MGLFGRDEKDPKEPAKDPLKDYRPTETRPQVFEPRTAAPPTAQVHLQPQPVNEHCRSACLRHDCPLRAACEEPTPAQGGRQ